MLSNKAKIEELIAKYSNSVKDAKLLRDTFEEIISKGIARGDFQDQNALLAALCIINCIEAECLVRAKEAAE
jgi:hypothetical protein